MQPFFIVSVQDHKWMIMRAMVWSLFFIATAATLNAQTILTNTSQVYTVKSTKSITVSEKWVASSEDLYNTTLTPASTTDEINLGFYFIESNMREDSIENIIKFELDSYREFASDQFEIKNMPTIAIDNDRSVAFYKHIYSAADAAYQAVAYIPESKSILAITLSTDSHKLFNEYLEDFEKMIQSYMVERERIQMVTRNTFY
jgi:hypothetical protein